MKTVISWNVNGIRAVQGKGFLDWLGTAAPDVCCLQETKALPGQLDAELLEPAGYRSLWHSAERKGYSGVAAYVRREPLSVEPLGTPEFDLEGRTMILEYPGVSILNCYFPNSQEAGARLDYKLAFCDAILDKCRELVGRGRHIVLCGDYNIAHQPIDLANPRQNEKNPGYLPEERAWMTKFLAAGFVDTFRQFCAEPNQYTWWSYRFHAREKNIGWRIDYHCVDQALAPRVRQSRILPDVTGSDHCPVFIELD